ncbi:MAG: inositol phosphorylceramide synthase [Marmoricola sp.]|nr:inositol phosphorylceramide synthase [Marmoricola sp.]
MKSRSSRVVVGVAITMSLLAYACSRWIGLPLRDPDGFLGPAYLRLPLLCGAAFLVDLVPRTLWRSHGVPTHFRREAIIVVKEHWTRERIVLVVVGLLSFYFTYVSYRNLKNFLPFVRTTDHGRRPLLFDDQLHALDRWLLFGHDPAHVLHSLLGTGIAAHVLAYDYLLFLPLVPVTVTAWLVWSKNISFGYWYVTSDVLCWALGTASYYVLPTLGPAFAFPWLYTDVSKTGVTSLEDALFYGRINLHVDPYLHGVQSVAAFASLHVAITLMMALVGQYTIRRKPIRITLWVYCAVTTVSTTYFGWHYLADDVAGALIGVVSFYVGARATGQTFSRDKRDLPTSAPRRRPAAETCRGSSDGLGVRVRPVALDLHRARTSTTPKGQPT